MRIDVLYFEPCPHHRPAVDLARSEAHALGINATIREIEVCGEADAQRHRFIGSPTIRVNGVDIDPSARQATEFGFSCRRYDTGGVPSRDMMRVALRAVVRKKSTAHRFARSGLVPAIGAVLSAVASSACCWVPLVLSAQGVALGASGTWMEQYRPLFIGLSAASLALAAFLIFRKRACCADTATCSRRATGSRAAFAMIIATTIAVAALTMLPSVIQGASRPDDAGTALIQNAAAPIELSIEGMTCAGCESTVRDALQAVDGVLDADVSYRDNLAVVRVEGAIESRRLAEAVRAVGYDATLTSRRGEASSSPRANSGD